MELDLPLGGAAAPGVPEATLCAMFDHAVATAPDKVALRHLGMALTYREMGRAVTALAQRLARLVSPGEVVALVLPNSIEFCVAYFAALRALAVPALLNPLYPAAQLSPLLRQARPHAVICAPPTRVMLAGLGDDLGIPDVVCLGQEIAIRELVAEVEIPLRLPTTMPTDPGALLFSGGTTGLSKAIEHTHARLAAAVNCVQHAWPTRNGEVFLPIAPFTHIYGFLMGVLVPVSACGETVIPERFQPEHVVELLVRHRVTFFGGGPPAIYAGVLAARNLDGADLSALRMCAAGGAPFPVELMERWRRATGLEIYEGYGMTEMAPISAVTAVSGIRPGSVGKPVLGADLQIVDLSTGLRVLPPGEKGEVRIRGPHMMTGYRNQPEETVRTIRDGFIYTGDIGYVDKDGFLFIIDRKKDVVFVKGFNVFPREVEEAIHTHRRVETVGVAGAPDARTGGERLVAFVVPRNGERVDAAEISAHCASRLIGYQCPAEVRIVAELPLTGAKKLDRIALRLAARGEQEPPTGQALTGRVNEE
jgi:long-chain acyl-CoA synthetase